MIACESRDKKEGGIEWKTRGHNNKKEKENKGTFTYRVFQGSWQKGGTWYIWYSWIYPEILLGGGSHKLFFLFRVS